MARPPEQVTIVEVGPRDGFQAESAFIPTATKIAVIDALSRAAVPIVEATSFVNPRVVPQLADAEAVMAGILRRPATAYVALIANVKGADRALSASVDALKFVLSATDEGNLKNVGRTVDQSIEEAARIVSLAAERARPVHAVIGLSFGCPFTGAVAPERVVQVAGQLAATGIHEIAIADSYGYANPLQVARLSARVMNEIPGVSLALHLHDTRGLAIANAVAGWQAGVARFESSIGGLGGALVAPGATGNVCTDDLVHLFHEMGVHTGIDLDALLEVTRMMEAALGRPLASRVAAAGTRAAAWRR